MKIIHFAARGRARTALVHLFLLTLALGLASCKRSDVAGNANSETAAGNTTSAEEASTTPPFSTREPERYQATMVTKGSLGERSNIPGMSEFLTREVLVARDGERRRVDAELFPGMKVAYLQLGAESYMLLPARKIYAEFGAGGASAPAKSSSSDFSPDKLLNQSLGGARYEKLGAEDVNGRATVKYRVTATGRTGEAKTVTTETLIWIDEALGMPIKSETTSRGAGAGDGAKYSMELRDIRQDVDASVFELPADYRKVDYAELQHQLMPSLPGSTEKD
jgi:hypothetical protein